MSSYQPPSSPDTWPAWKTWAIIFLFFLYAAPIAYIRRFQRPGVGIKVHH